jgi:hypothetical protein
MLDRGTLGPQYSSETDQPAIPTPPPPIDSPTDNQIRRHPFGGLPRVSGLSSHRITPDRRNDSGEWHFWHAYPAMICNEASTNELEDFADRDGCLAS